MDPIARMVAAGAAGAAGGGSSATYVDDVFSTFVYEASGTTQTINNGINLGSTIRSLSAYRDSISTMNSSVDFDNGTNNSSYGQGKSWQEVITNGILSGTNSDYLYSNDVPLDIKVDLGEAKVVSSFAVAPQGDTSNGAVYNTPSSLTLYGSNNGSEWHNLSENTGLSSSNFTVGELTEFTFSNSTAYRYWRLYAPAYTSISEWQIAHDSGTPGEGGMVWLKNRANGGSYTNHAIVDSERIGNSYKSIYPNLTESEYDPSPAQAVVTSFNSDGFTRGGNANVTNGDNVSWTFRKAPGFFDIQTWTGDGLSSREIAHNLDSTPGMILVKPISSTTLPNGNPAHWIVWHRENGHPAYSPNNYAAFLNRDVASDPSAAYWQDTAPTSTHFTVGITNNQNNLEYVAYIFAHDDARFGKNEDESIIKCGRYTGNGFSSSGPEIDLGFEPQWLLIKSSYGSNAAGIGWYLFDNIRGIGAPGVNDKMLSPNTSGTDSTGSRVGITPTGFKLTTSSGVVNGSGTGYIYMAIRRPHKPPTAGTDVFALDATSASGSTGNAFDAPFPVDMEWHQHWGANVDKYVGTRLNSGEYLVANSNAAPASGTAMTFDSSDGVLTAFNHIGYSAQMFKRAPGFFDLVGYTGNNSTQLISHNLEAIPELIIIKNRTSIGEWVTYAPSIFTHQYNGTPTNTGYMRFSSGGSTFNPLDNVWPWNSTAPTSSTFSVGYSSNIGSDYQTNESSKDYIALLFASLPGISKVGTYSGTGSNVDVNCGFAAGARFVLIKRTDSSGDWYLWDTAHGITSGNDPHLLLNKNEDEVTGTDYIDPLNAGFTVTSNAPTALNESGGTYLFLAIA